MRKIILLMIISALILPVHYFNIKTVIADSTNYYIANNGDDSNPGTEAEPWKTIGKVNAALSDGTISLSDNIYFKRGDDFSGTTSLYPRIGGTVSDYMIYGAYGTGDKPILSNTASDGRTIDATDATGYMHDTGYYIFENMEINNCGMHGIRLREGGVHDIIIRDIDFINVGDYGVHLQHVDTFKVENCNYINGGRTGFLAQGTTSGSDPTENGKFWNLTVDGATVDGISLHCLNTENNYVGSNIWIENCIISGCGEAGIDLAVGTNPVGGYYINDVEIFDCTGGVVTGVAAGHSTRRETYNNIYIHDCGATTFGFTRDRYAILRNSIIETWGSDKSAIVINQNIDNYNSQDIAIYNNNIISDGDSDHVKFIRSTTGITDNLLFKNNILYSTQSSSPTRFINYVAGGGGTDLTSSNSDWSYNMWWRRNGNMNGDHWYDGSNGYLNWAEWLSQPEVSNDLREDPDFDDPLNSDFSLKSTSPCIDAGDWLTTTNGGGTSSTVVTVHESLFFMDGYDIDGLSSDNIFVGDNTDLEITDIDYSSHQITVNRSISWNDGDPVSLSSYSGSKVDIGALEFVLSGPDTIPPVISNVILSSSDPLDTDLSFGWSNISSTITDNSAVGSVYLNITHSDGSYDNFSMNNVGSSYYYNVSETFSEYGNYSYYIWANDTNGNPSITTDYDFSMPPNWDINNDGQVTILDLILISNRYGEIGPNGWIREDVDNNGIIQVLDLVLVIAHYYDLPWWT